MLLAVRAGHLPKTLGQSVGLQWGPALHSLEKCKGEKTSVYMLREWELMDNPGTRPDRNEPTIK